MRRETRKRLDSLISPAQIALPISDDVVEVLLTYEWKKNMPQQRHKPKIIQIFQFGITKLYAKYKIPTQNSYKDYVVPFSQNLT